MGPNDFNWFKIFNADEFTALGLVSRVYTVNLIGIGEKDILVTRGNYLSITYEGVMLDIGMNERSPFIFDGFAAYQAPSGNVFLGVPK